MSNNYIVLMSKIVFVSVCDRVGVYGIARRQVYCQLYKIAVNCVKSTSNFEIISKILNLVVCDKQSRNITIFQTEYLWCPLFKNHRDMLSYEMEVK